MPSSGSMSPPSSSGTFFRQLEYICTSMAGPPGFLRTRKVWLIAAAIASLAAFAIGVALFRAARGLEKAQNAAAENDIPFHALRVNRRATPFEPISAPAVFRDATVFAGNLYL